MRGMTAVALGLALTGLARAQQNAGQAEGARPSNRAGGDNMADRDLPGPIDNLQDLQDTGKMLFKLADMNNDGQISQKEAIDAGNLLVGGFFFRADQDGNGTISREEARTARDNLLRQQPALRLVLNRARAAQGGGQGGQQQGGQQRGQGGQQGGGTQTPVAGLANLLDENNDKQLQASEVRDAVKTAVQGLYASADTNRDNQLSPSELNAAMYGAVRQGMQAAFQQADKDNNNALSEQEFEQAMVQPARAIFRMLDANGDGQLTQQEAQQAQRIIASQVRMLRVQEPANSPGNLIESGQRPGQAAPAPNFGAPGQNQPNAPQRTQPAPGGSQPQP